MDYLTIITNVIALSAILPLALFVFFYGSKKVPGKKFRRYSKLWRQTDIGKTLMYQKLAWIVFLVFIALSLFWDSFPAREYFRVGVYLALVVLFWRVLYVLRRLQKSDGSAHSDTK